MSSEAESIAQGGLYLPLLCFVECQIQFGIDFGVVSEMVDGGRDEIMLHGEYAGDGLYGTGGASFG